MVGLVVCDSETVGVAVGDAVGVQVGVHVGVHVDVGVGVSVRAGSVVNSTRQGGTGQAMYATS